MEIAIFARFVKIIITDSRRQIHLNYFLSSVVVIWLLVLLANHSIILALLPHFCLLKAILNIPCPGCGVLRGLVSLLSFDFASAWQYNPVSFLILAIITLQIPLRLVALAFLGLSSAVTTILTCLSSITVFSLILVWTLELLSL